MITSENHGLQNLLLAGIAAVKRRDLRQGCALLLQVVDKDDQQELAWLWLSVAVTAPADREVALENVLTINPANATAQKRLARLRRQQEVAEMPPTLAPEDYLAGAAPDVDERIDDPCQCVYCGEITAEADKTCPSCGRNLYKRMPKAEVSEVLKMALLLLGVMAAIGAVQVATPFLALTASQTAAKGDFEVILKMPGVELLLGNFLKPAFTAAVAKNLIIAFLGRSGLLAILLFGLSQRWRPVYYAALVLLIVDIGWNVYLLFMGYLGLLAGILNAFLTVLSLALLSASDREFAVIMERLWTKPDSKARSAADFYRRGLAYRQDGMWALAVAQFRKAVGLAPTAVAYYKDLGIGYAQIGHFDRSLRVLEEAQRQAPEDAQIPKIIQVVREQVAQQAKPAGSA